MAGRFPLGKPRLPSWALPLMAVSVTLTVHAIWLVLPQTQFTAQVEVTPARLFAYPNLDARTWSPTLFSLPSSLGFSGAIKQNASTVRPPLQSPVQLTGIEPLVLEQVFPEPGLEAALAAHSRLPVTVFPDPAPEVERPVAFEWSLQILDGPASRLEINRLPPPPPGGNPLVLTGVLSFDEVGQVNSLFLDPNSLSMELRTRVLRSLRRVRRSGDSSPTRIRFRFAYLPSESAE